MTRPSREQSRRETIRRVQVGMGGLAGVLMLVGLTNLVIENMRKDGGLDTATLKLPELTGSANVATAPAQSSEPLADLGVAPSASESAAPAVPDLEPVPRLQKPMDRDPRQTHR